MKTAKTFAQRFGRLALAASALVLASASAFAAGYRTIVVTPYEGEPVNVKISETLSTTFDGAGNIHFTDGESNTTLALTNLCEVGFSTEATTGIGAPSMADDVTIEAGRIVLGNLAPGSHIVVAAIDGRIMLSATAEGSYTVDLNALGTGVYVISYNKRSLKIAVK